jgi:transposase
VDELKKRGVQLIEVERVNDKEECVYITRGYETSRDLTAEVNRHLETWTERRFLIQSTSGDEAAKRSLLERIEKAEKAIQDILVRKQGKPRITERVEIDKAIQKVLEKFHVEGLLTTVVQEGTQEKYVRAYKGNPPEVRQELTYTIKSERDEKSILYAIYHLSWRVYATNQKKDNTTLEQVVETYRDEYRVERCFEHLKDHPLSLAPLYVQRDDHRVGLVRLLTIALRVLTLLEGVICQSLQEQKEEITGLYAGNPKRRTAQPTAEHLLKAFSESDAHHCLYSYIYTTSYYTAFTTSKTNFVFIRLYACCLLPIS